MPKESKLRKMSNSRRANIFRDRSLIRSRALVDKVASRIDKVGLHEADKKILAQELSDIVYEEMTSPEFYRHALKFPRDVDPIDVKNIDNITEYILSNMPKNGV